MAVSPKGSAGRCGYTHTIILKVKYPPPHLRLLVKVQGQDTHVNKDKNIVQMHSQISADPVACNVSWPVFKALSGRLFAIMLVLCSGAGCTWLESVSQGELYSMPVKGL